LFIAILLLNEGCISEESVATDSEAPFTLQETLVFPDVKFHQSMVFYNDYACFVTPDDSRLCCDIYSIKDKNKLAGIVLPYDGYRIPHANTTCLGGQLYDGNSIIPTLYVSSWCNDRQAFVYDIRIDGKTIMANLLQIIDPKGVNKDIIGGGYLDWVVDQKEGILYSLSYHIEGSSRVEIDNYTHIAKFKLPSLSDQYVVLTDSDVLEHFNVPVMTVFQDKFFYDNHIYIVAGTVGEEDKYPPRFYDIDVINKTMQQKLIPMRGEPEGFCYYQGIKWLNMGGSTKVYNLDVVLN
jgi:hypothetical protein